MELPVPSVLHFILIATFPLDWFQLSTNQLDYVHHQSKTECSMRILSWNVNGIRTLSQYHPWYTLKTCQEMLKELKADILCFQEMKVSRQLLTPSFGIPEGYDAVMSFPKNKGGYSGVAVYTNSAKTVALKAEEGLTGGPQTTSRATLDTAQKISSVYPTADTLELMPDALDDVPNDLSDLDSEGRAVVVDFGLFVLINVYCPNETSDERLPFKFNFHKMLEERVKILLREGREVIVLGDMNVVAAPIDHCDGSLESKKNEFWKPPVRAWYRQWLYPEGPMVDTIRNVWPGREDMFTCWNTRTNARESNYGTRIDYILITQGLLPWLKHGDIQPDIRGSDHCPVFIDLHDEITLSDGQILHLVDKISPPSDETGCRKDPPRVSTKFWEEFSGRQKLLSSFFSKKSTIAAQSGLALSKNGTQIELVSCSEPSASHSDKSASLVADSEIVLEASTSVNSQEYNAVTESSSQSLVPPQGQRRKATSSAIRSVEPKPKKPRKNVATSQHNQLSKLAAFFVGGSKQQQGISMERPHSPPIELSSDSDEEQTGLASSSMNDSTQVSEMASMLISSQTTDRGTSKAAWSKLMKPPEPPRCTVHNVPATEHTVKKTGPNKGKRFFLCSMPMGPGYDSGKSTRLREEVDPKYRCNYFKWASDAKKEARLDSW